MVLIVGLGNPGSEYENTRHNIGWIVLSSFVEKNRLPSFSRSHTYNALFTHGVLYEHEISIIFPQAFMNNSGSVVQKYIKGHATKHTLVVVHDDIDLPFGEMKISSGRGAGGHNGVRSIIESVGNKDFIRIRVGIGKKNLLGMMRRPRGDALSRFVLAPFTKSEQKEIEVINEHVEKALQLIVTKGVETAMQECNKG